MAKNQKTLLHHHDGEGVQAPIITLDDAAKIRLKCLEIAQKFSPEPADIIHAAKQLEQWVLTGQ